MSTGGVYTIKLKGLTFKHGSRAIFNNIDVRIPRGKMTGIMGPSGYGKTMLLRLVAFQSCPSKGEVWVNGQNLPQLSRGDLFDVHKQLGVLFQSGTLFTDLDAFEDVAFPLHVHTQLPEEVIRDIALMKLQAIGLRGAVELMPDELSGGMKRRVALARTIALNPQTLLYDKPFVRQDPIATGVLVHLIHLLNDVFGVTSIMVSHDLAEAAGIADYVYIIGNGRVLSHRMPGVPREIDGPRTYQFVRGIPDGPTPSHYPARDYRVDLLGEH